MCKSTLPLALSDIENLIVSGVTVEINIVADFPCYALGETLLGHAETSQVNTAQSTISTTSTDLSSSAP